MIRIVLGQVGSGKTASVVRELVNGFGDRPTYTNIHIRKAKNVRQITADMIFKKEVVKVKKDGSEVTKLQFNKEFWRGVREKEGSINVVIDEAHMFFDARRSMSNVNKIMSNFLSELRRILGQDSNGYGELILITQLSNRLDVHSRDMATKVQYHQCYFNKSCRCGFAIREDNENPDPMFRCPYCSAPLKKHSHTILIYHFSSMDNYETWKHYRMKSYYRITKINDIEDYFSYYDTLQWDDLFEDIYEN